MNRPKIIGIIPARFNSTRFPGKLLADLQGKPVIQRTFESAKRCKVLDDVFIATDDQRISECAHGFGAQTYLTSPHCATGTERLSEVIKNEKDMQKSEIIVNIQGDEPLIEPEVIQAVVDELLFDPDALMATAVVPFKDIETAKDPHVVKCVRDENHNALYFSRSCIPSGSPKTYYKHLGIYAFRTPFLLHYSELEPTPLQLAEDLEQLKVLEHGYKIKVALVESQSIGVDTPQDLEKVKERLCTQNTSSSQAESAPH